MKNHHRLFDYAGNLSLMLQGSVASRRVMQKELGECVEEELTKPEKFIGGSWNVRVADCLLTKLRFTHSSKYT